MTSWSPAAAYRHAVMTTLADPSAVAESCQACGSSRTRRMRTSHRFGLDVARCRDCRMVFVVDAAAHTHVDSDPADDEFAISWESYTDGLRGDTALRSAVLERLRGLVGAGRPRLFDIGAGAGEFLVNARDHGFDVAGNDISRPAIDYVHRTHGIEVSDLPLGEQPEQSADVVTMWCVLAHVPDTRQFLRETFRLLRPGGYVFIRTPRRCGIDALGRLAERATLGRFDQISDRRVNPGHLHLYNEKSITRQLQSLGFDRIVVEPEAHYTFSTESYLDSAGGPVRVLGRAAPVIDKLIEKDWFFRNALMVYARRPSSH